MDLSRLTLGDKVVGAAGIVLLIDLVFLPWHSWDRGIVPTVTRSGIESPNGFWGMLALLITIVVVVAVAVLRFSDVEPSDLPWRPVNRAVFVATIAVLVALVVKLLAKGSSLGVGAWLGLLLAAGMVYGGYLKDHELPTR